MGKRIAVITGASSGIGRCFALTAEKHGKFDELWAIARREDRLEELKSLVNVPVRPLPMDLTDRENLPSSREEGLRLLHGLATNLATSLQTPQEA